MKMESETNSVYMEISSSGRSRDLSILRKMVCCIAHEVGFDEEEIAKIEMSVDEACANVVCHAYKQFPSLAGEKRCLIKLVIEANEEQMHITISDYGVGDSEGPHNGVEDLQEYARRGHGLGTYIIRKFMDQVEFCYPGDSGTKVSMVKYISRNE